MANKGWRAKFPEAKVYHVSMAASDHCLLALSLKKSKPQRKRLKRFFFEAMWAKEGECKEIIEQAWDPYRVLSDLSIEERLSRCQNNLRWWNQTMFGNVNKKLRQKKNRLQQLELLNMLNDNEAEIKELRQEVNEVLNREEIMWKQRSRVDWLQYGDRNTKFFHAAASQRRSKIRIEGLWDSECVWQEEEGITEAIILDYFKNIFTSDCPTNFDASIELLKSVLLRK